MTTYRAWNLKPLDRSALKELTAAIAQQSTEELENRAMEAMDAEQTTPSLSQAQRLKKFSQEGRLTEEAMSAIMSEEKKSDMDKVTLRSDTLRRYFPKSYTPKQMEQTIIKLLDVWQKQRQKNQER